MSGAILKTCLPFPYQCLTLLQCNTPELFNVLCRDYGVLQKSTVICIPNEIVSFHQQQKMQSKLVLIFSITTSLVKRINIREKLPKDRN